MANKSQCCCKVFCMWIKCESGMWNLLASVRKKKEENKTLGLQTPNKRKSLKFCAGFSLKPDAFRAPVSDLFCLDLAPESTKIFLRFPHWEGARGRWDGKRGPGKNCARMGERGMFCCHYHGFSCSQLGEDVTLLLQHHGLKPDINTDIPKLLSKSPKAQARISLGGSWCCRALSRGSPRLEGPCCDGHGTFCKKIFLVSFSCNEHAWL